MTNPFELHGIGHLSPSSLNTFAAAPAVWVMERLCGRKAPVGCAAYRGTSAEYGIQLGLEDFSCDVSECQKEAVAKFDHLSALSGDPKRAKEREAIPGIVATGLEQFRKGGQPTGYQGKVVHEFDELPVPILGFWDFAWEQHGMIVDLKSQLKLSSSISDGHARQVSLYVHKTNFVARVAYVTPAKSNVLTLHNPADHLSDLVNIAQRLGKFLSISKDPYELAGLLVPDLDSFYLSNPVAKANARELYGFHKALAPEAAAAG
ncbi:hypothetical protein [Acetobacter sp. DsW_063]|uniref:hypothetical protein n=1 Tax=Acetobacter sp. DsW_063 TaxID=1514894 RepID=UPI000A381C79|nr:hypothetical protein [Acetobacter sp. DsW_063]OUJ16501.1 hypothetical protein HK28_12575 [Acetobacter sp. DsW_063]